jgi:hypothetical protein
MCDFARVFSFDHCIFLVSLEPTVSAGYRQANSEDRILRPATTLLRPLLPQAPPRLPRRKEANKSVRGSSKFDADSLSRNCFVVIEIGFVVLLLAGEEEKNLCS